MSVDQCIGWRCERKRRAKGAIEESAHDAMKEGGIVGGG
jgi:hypothetical protein